MRLVVIADTHVPRRAKDLPAPVWHEIDRADVVIHAGDWVDESLLDAVESRAARLIGVWGNNDGPALRRRLPEVAQADLDGLKLAVVHETGARTGRETRVDRAFPGTDVVVFGHSHIPWDTVTAAGVRLLNPGSPTDRRRQPVCTFLTAQVRRGRLTDVELVPLA